MAKRTDDRIDRRTVLKGIGLGAVGVGGATGVASAHHVAALRGLNGIPNVVVAGEPFTFNILWTSGHGGQACFVAAINGSNWTEVGRVIDSSPSAGTDETTQITATVPEGTPAGAYSIRVSATEWSTITDPGSECPEPGETGETGRTYVEHTDVNIEVEPPVEVHDVSFRGCGQVWVAFDSFPVNATTAQVNVDGNWKDVTINKSDLTRIPGQYGRNTPVFRYRPRGNGKLVGLRIVGTEYTNDNRCAQNV